MENEAQAAAGRLLREAVSRSRGKQTEVASPAGADLEQPGEGRGPFRHLSPGTPSGATMEGLSQLLATWVKRQDGLDRKRKHFPRDFRDQHGYDRRDYNEEQRADYGNGLDAVHAEENEGRQSAQLEVLELACAAST